MASELRDGMKIDWDCPIEMDDGLIVRADIFRPEADGRYPVILSYGPYGKGLAFQEGYPSAWNRMALLMLTLRLLSDSRYSNALGDTQSCSCF